MGVDTCDILACIPISDRDMDVLCRMTSLNDAWRASRKMHGHRIKPDHVHPPKLDGIHWYNDQRRTPQQFIEMKAIARMLR